MCCVFFLVTYFVVTHVILGETDNLYKEINIYGISSLDHDSSKSIVGAQWLAIQETNNNSKLLSNYKLNLKVLDDESNAQYALRTALNIVIKNNVNESIFPIILGAEWSSISTTISPILNAYNLGEMSSSSTSIVLSDTMKYPYFYRTIPSDTLQSEGIILLCNTFNWTKIAIIYEKDVYGLYLSLGIQELATKYNIDATGIAVSENEELTYKYAAEQIVELNVFIIVVITHNNNIIPLFNTFKNEGILGYPYFYLGVDGWFDETVINQYNMNETVIEAAAGFIGTVPWQTQSLSLNEYNDDIRSVVNQSIKLIKQWQYYYNNQDSEYLRLERPGTFAIYGYDAMYTLIYAMQQIEDNPGLYGDNLFDLIQNGNKSKIIDILNDIIVNKTDFIGASGHVCFDKNGDRINGLYLLGNILSNGNTDYFGYCR